MDDGVGREGGVGSDVGIESDEAVVPECDGWPEEREEGIGHVVCACTEVGFGVDDAVIADGDGSERVEDRVVCDRDIVPEMDVPRDDDVDIARQSASFAYGASEESQNGGSGWWNGDPEGASERTPECADDALFFGPDTLAFGRVFYPGLRLLGCCLVDRLVCCLILVVLGVLCHKCPIGKAGLSAQRQRG